MSRKSVKYFPEVDTLEHEDTTPPETKRVLLYGWDSNNLQKARLRVDGSGNLILGETTPMDSGKNNGSLIFTYDVSDHVISILKLINGIRYEQTLTYDGDNCTAISSWSRVGSTSPSVSPSKSPSISPSKSPSVSPSVSTSPSVSISPSISPSTSPSVSPST